MYGNKGLVVVGISMDQNTALVAPFLKKYNLTFLNLLDPYGEVFPTFGVRYTPTNFFVNRSGQVIGGSLGYRDWDSTESHRLVKALLAEQAIQKTKTTPAAPKTSPGS